VGYREEIFRHEPAAKTGSRKRVKVGEKKKEEIEFTEKRLLYQKLCTPKRTSFGIKGLLKRS
jgi:hypothetical protein